MSGNTNGSISGISTTGGGVALLPFTGGNILLTVLSISLIAVGSIVMLSLIASRIYSRFV
jgi:hypothetical protein